MSVVSKQNFLPKHNTSKKKVIVWLVFLSLFSTGCVNELKVTIPTKKSNSFSNTLNVTISNIEVVNNQIVITGTNLDKVDNFNITEGAIVQNMAIESKTASTIIANTISNVTFAAGKMMDFVLSNAEAASSFSVNFSLCDSSLGGKGFNCAAVPTAGQFLAYDGATGKWIPKSISGLLSYKGSWNPAGAFPTPAVSGDYYIAGSDSGIYYSGDWIVYNGATWDKISNSNTVTSVYGRHGAITAEEGDYTLDLLDDVEILGTPTVGQVLKYDASGKWIPGTVSTTDPAVKAFAKANLPVCSASEVLSSDGTSLGCVTDVSGGGAYTGGANFVLVTNGAGAISDSAITTTKLNYLSAVTSDIQAQINGKASTASIVDWSAPNAALTIDPTRLNLTTAGRAVVTSGSGQLAVSAVTSTQVGYLSNVTSDIQAQINAKLSSETNPGVETFAKTSLPVCSAGQVLFTNGTTLTCVTDTSGASAFSGTANRAVMTDGSGALTVSTITNTELGYLSGITGNIMTLLGQKQTAFTGSTGLMGGSLRLYNPAQTFYTEITSNTTANRTLILPNTNGSSGNVLTTNGSGTLSWTAPAAGGVTSVNSQVGAVDLNTDNIPEGAANKYYTDAKVRATPLTGFALGTNTTVTATDTVLAAFGKVQKQIDDTLTRALTGLSVAISTPITASDSILVAFGRLQAQITGQGTTIAGKANMTDGSQSIVASTISVGSVTGLTTPLLGTNAANRDYVDSKATQWTTATTNVYFTTTATGNVGIGTGTPVSKLEVKNGSITTAYATTATLANDFATANVIATTVAAGTLNLQNMKDGTSYTLIIQNTGSYTLGGSSVTTWKCAPACASGVLSNTSGHMLVTILKAGTTAYVSYIGDM